jgi:hypothetical protein
LGLVLTFASPAVQGVKDYVRVQGVKGYRALVDPNATKYEDPDASYYEDNAIINDTSYVNLGSFNNNLDAFDYNTTDDYELEPFEPVGVNRILQSNDIDSRDLPDIPTHNVSRLTKGKKSQKKSKKSQKKSKKSQKKNQKKNKKNDTDD